MEERDMSKGRVLVVDDEARYRDDFERFFKSLGYEVDTATNYLGGRKLLDTHTYILIFCDNAMPIANESKKHGMAGVELLGYSKMSELNENTPFIVNTGDDRDSTKEIVVQLGGVYRYKQGKIPVSEFLKPYLPH